MPRFAAAAAIAILLLGAGAVFAVWLATREGAAPTADAAASPPAAPAAADGAPLQRDPSRLPPGASPVEPAPLPVVVAPRPPPPPPDSWEAVPQLARPGAAGPAGLAVARGLNDLDPLLSACFEPDSQARYRSQTATLVRDAETVDAAAVPILVLQVETQPARVRIVDAPVEVHADQPDAVLACAQQVLRGRTFPAPGVTAGSRYRIRFQLMH